MGRERVSSLSCAAPETSAAINPGGTVHAADHPLAFLGQT